MPLELKKITQTIRASGMAEQFKGVESFEAINWLRSNCPRAYEQVRDFIRLHGYRGIEEFELMTETWGMRPEKFLSTVQVGVRTIRIYNSYISSCNLSEIPRKYNSNS